MQAGAIVRFGGITAYGDKYHGRGFHFTDLIGLPDAPEVDLDLTKRPTEHGAFLAEATLEERTVRIPGFYVGPTHQHVQNEGNRLRGLLTSRLRLVVETPLGTEWVSGVVTQARMTPRGFFPEADWSVEVVCEDPRVYGEVEDFPGGQVAIHRGNFPARPQLVVSGTAAGGYTVTGPGGRRVVVTKALVSGSPHTIDFAKGGLYINGVRQLRAISIYEPWDIAPGLPGAMATVNNGLALIQRVTKTSI